MPDQQSFSNTFHVILTQTINTVFVHLSIFNLAHMFAESETTTTSPTGETTVTSMYYLLCNDIVDHVWSWTNVS